MILEALPTQVRSLGDPGKFRGWVSQAPNEVPGGNGEQMNTLLLNMAIENS